MANKSSTILSQKHVKLSESSDRISNLPEPVLHHMFTLLSIKEAARTSVLSKRWQVLWTTVPDMILCQYGLRADDMSLKQIILKIFLSRRAWCIREFRLLRKYDRYGKKVCSISCDDDVDILIFRMDPSILLCEVDIEEEHFFPEEPENARRMQEFLELPPTLFCCETLVVLKLYGIPVSISSSSVDFPNLKVMSLGLVKYKDEDAFRNLISGCPVLEDLLLAVDQIDPDNAFHYEISSLTVRNVRICKLRRTNYPPPSKIKITVSAPALEHFTIDHTVDPCALVLHNVPNSVHANFNTCRLEWRENYWDAIKIILEALRNVQFLELNFTSKREPTHNIPEDIFPRFDNLVEFKLVGNRCPLPVLRKMLLNCSRLEHLTIAAASKRVLHSDCLLWTKCWVPPERVPNCLAFHLTTVKFEGFEGWKGETQFAQYVLDNSKLLTNMTISYIHHWKMKQKFDAFRKISENSYQTRCQLSFQQQLTCDNIF